MSLERAKKYLEEKGYADHVIELEESSATVQLAAEALGVEQGMIAKTMSFLVDGEPILILTEGTAKVDNRKKNISDMPRAVCVHLELKMELKFI